MKDLSVPRHLHKFLATLGASPHKRLGQHFLVDGNIARKIIAAAVLQETDHVVEIGPGPGVLTELIYPHVQHVIAVEKDPIFAEAISRFGEKISVVQADILQCSFDRWAQQEKVRSFVVISNLPYYVTSPILTSLLFQSGCISRLVVMMQEEAAERLFHKKKGPLAVLLDILFRRTQSFTVSRHCFWPKPHVNSQVIALEATRLISAEKIPAFCRFVREAFRFPKKRLFRSLVCYYDEQKICKTFSALQFCDSVRHQDLEAQMWIQLFYALYSDGLDSNCESTHSVS